MISKFLFTLIFISSYSCTDGLKCHSCANDFIVWHWRHFFLKRNYGLTTSDQSCIKFEYDSPKLQPCATTCFILYLNGTNRYSGEITVLGVGRGCSSKFLTNEQHSQITIGSYSKESIVRHYLSQDFDMFDISEHWCFCANDGCNTHECFDNYSEYTRRRSHYFFRSYSQNTSNLIRYNRLMFFVCSFILFFLPKYH